jgi:hypothetical protein
VTRAGQEPTARVHYTSTSANAEAQATLALRAAVSCAISCRNARVGTSTGIMRVGAYAVASTRAQIFA